MREGAIAVPNPNQFIIMKSAFSIIVCALSALSAAAQTDSIACDSIAAAWERQLQLDEVVVVARRPVVKQQEGKLVYLVKNDPYSKGLDGLTLLDRIPRVAVENGSVKVAGKGKVRYIIDGILMELDDEAMATRLRALQADNIEKIELISTPPSRYAVEPNAVYLSIVTKDETLGTRGSVYGSLNFSDKLSEYLSGSVNHTTRRVELSLDANLHDLKVVNDLDAEYRFADHVRLSRSRSDSHIFNTGFNALFRYKFSSAMSAGVIVNYKYDNVSGKRDSHTDYGDYTSVSHSDTKERPVNALTVTGFYDWTFGKNGEQLQLTYNLFTKHDPSCAIVSTLYDITELGDVGIAESSVNDYTFHSGKVDFKLPYKWAQIEAGIAYTDIDNSSSLELNDRIGNAWVPNTNESNAFDYRERIGAAYLSASRSLGSGLWGKIGLRYEYTWTRSYLRNNSITNRDDYGRLFPTLNLSWNKDKIGSFNLSYSMGMGRPNFWDLNPFRFYQAVDDYASGNPDLKPTLYHNAEINYYGLGGLYAVLYTSFAEDAISYVSQFDADGVKSTIPYNCLSTNKTGLYASYRRNIFQWWEMNVGGEVFHSHAHGNRADFQTPTFDDWSGKIEVSANWMLNQQKTLTFNARFTHYFPWHDSLVEYKDLQLLSLTLRYSLLDNRLNLRLSANDIFGWNKSRSTQKFRDFTLRQTFDSHQSQVIFGITYNFGGNKVNRVWRDSKESQSSRTSK